MVQLINKGSSSCGSGSMGEPPACGLFSFFYFVPSANHPKETTGRESVRPLSHFRESSGLSGTLPCAVISNCVELGSLAAIDRFAVVGPHKKVTCEFPQTLIKRHSMLSITKEGCCNNANCTTEMSSHTMFTEGFFRRLDSYIRIP